MPVTARLSKAFYDRFGDEIVAELVEWFNLLDSTYRSELRELNEINFARFDAKLEQRIVESEARLERLLAAFIADIERRMVTKDRIAALATKDQIAGLATQEELKQLRAEMRLDIEGAVSDLRKEMLGGFAALGTQLANAKAELMKWSFVFWVGAVLAIAALAGVLRWTS